MKLLLLVAVFVVCVSAISKETALKEWDLFKQKYQKTYEATEETVRLSNFMQSLVRVEQKNAELDEPVFGITKFSDLTPAEFKQQYLGFKRSNKPRSIRGELYESNVDSISSIDWRTKGMITPVKDQGQCGSCWAFSAVEETESMWLMAGKSQQIFAPQQVVSCDKVDGGCDGGDTPTAYKYIKQAGGLELESDYPYTSGANGRTGQCKYSASKVAGGDNNGFYWATAECEDNACKNQNETQLLQALQTAPISICVNAEPWQDYVSGVMKHSSCSGAYYDLDHCVQLVGYTAASTPYYMVRNSWNTDWGYDGYIYLSVGENTCGVADEATIVKIDL